MDESHEAKPANDPKRESAAGSQLPVVWSPPLSAGAGAEEPMQAAEAASSAGEGMREESAGPAYAAMSPPAQGSRFMLLAACVGIAAAVGAVAGSLSATGLSHVMYGGGTASGGMNEARAASAQAVQAVKAELAELATLKTNFDSATKATNCQFAKLSDRLDRVERAEAEPSTKIAHIADAVDRLEKRAAAAPETTGSIASSAPASPPSPEPQASDRIVPNWIVQDVRGKRALVASRFGGLYAVAAGSSLPGLGRVETIERQNGQWVVVTERGMIVSGR